MVQASLLLVLFRRFDADDDVADDGCGDDDGVMNSGWNGRLKLTAAAVVAGAVWLGSGHMLDSWYVVMGGRPLPPP